MAGKSAGSGRTRNFATVVYPESAPENWLEILAESFVPAFVSPLHDLDQNPTGEKKKEHYHVVLMFDSVKTLDQARDITESIGGVGCEKVNSIRGYARYLCHLDNPEKAKYDTNDVKCFGGSDYYSVIGLVTDKYAAIKDMIAFCRTNEIDSYSDLLEYAAENRFDWFRVLCDNGTVVMKEYLKSVSWKKKQSPCISYRVGDAIIDEVTGELLSITHKKNSPESESERV